MIQIDYDIFLSVADYNKEASFFFLQPKLLGLKVRGMRSNNDIPELHFE